VALHAFKIRFMARLMDAETLIRDREPSSHGHENRGLDAPNARASPKRTSTNFRHLIPMVGCPGENGGSPVELFGQHQAHKFMWPDHSSKRQLGMGTVPEIGIQPIRAANQKRHVPDTIVAPFAQLTGEFG